MYSESNVTSCLKRVIECGYNIFCCLEARWLRAFGLVSYQAGSYVNFRILNTSDAQGIATFDTLVIDYGLLIAISPFTRGL